MQTDEVGQHCHVSGHRKRRKRCLLCDVDAKPESVLVTPSYSAAVRSVMLLELQHRGVVPDRKIFAIMAREYNTRVVATAQSIGEMVPKWTPRDVRLHFENCVTLVPRIESAKQYHTVNKIKTEILQRELYVANDDGVQVVNQKALENQVNCFAGLLHALVLGRSKRLSSCIWASAIAAGASIITSRPELFFGNAM